jgi:hypothetical protein
MKDNIRTIIGLALVIISFVALIAAAIWAIVFNLMNPDMTELRLFIENPYPTIIAFVSIVTLMVGKLLLGWVD